MHSKLGYLLSDLLPTKYSLAPHTSALHVTNQNTNSNLKQFWELESTGTNATPGMDINKSFLTSDYSTTHVSRQSDGSYCAKLPWKPIANKPRHLFEEYTLPCQPFGTDANIA